MKYRYTKARDRYAASVIDILGALYARLRGARTVSPAEIRTVCFVQLAHIGDLVLTMPVLNAFKKNSGRKVHLAVNPENAQWARRLSFVDKVFVVEQPGLRRGGSCAGGVRRQFADMEADLVFELRGDMRILPLLKLFSRHKYLAGYAAGGGGFLLDIVLPYPFGEHIMKTYQGLFGLFGIPEGDMQWDPQLLPCDPFDCGLKDYVCLSVGSGTQAKDWGAENFAALAKMLAGRASVVLIGRLAPGQMREYESGLASCGNVRNLINKTTLLESAGVVKGARLFVGLDSGFTHVSALLGKKTVALYSGTNPAGVWDPVELFPGQISVIRKEHGCGGCGKTYCHDNVCMRSITVEEVYMKALEMAGQ
ncbi:MAG: glycosyltransferase family 9 protein [Elusimicrobiales bacterium]|nr:glycosyltransferase family 9 protein [Elusimicrobiales bacterium]